MDNTTAVMVCPCGCGLTSDRWTDAKARDYVFEQIMTKGPALRITLGTQTWMVPRLYIAFHGISSNRIPELAAKLHWPEAAKTTEKYG